MPSHVFSVGAVSRCAVRLQTASPCSLALRAKRWSIVRLSSRGGATRRCPVLNSAHIRTAWHFSPPARSSQHSPRTVSPQSTGTRPLSCARRVCARAGGMIGDRVVVIRSENTTRRDEFLGQHTAINRPATRQMTPCAGREAPKRDDAKRDDAKRDYARRVDGSSDAYSTSCTGVGTPSVRPRRTTDPVCSSNSDGRAAIRSRCMEAVLSGGSMS